LGTPKFNNSFQEDQDEQEEVVVGSRQNQMKSPKLTQKLLNVDDSFSNSYLYSSGGQQQTLASTLEKAERTTAVNDNL
jgi:hypothetical protein